MHKRRRIWFLSSNCATWCRGWSQPLEIHLKQVNLKIHVTGRALGDCHKGIFKKFLDLLYSFSPKLENLHLLLIVFMQQKTIEYSLVPFCIALHLHKNGNRGLTLMQ